MGKYIESDIQIRFADADSLGHINNVNLQHYFDVGKMEFYEKVLGKTIDPDAESLILVSIHTNYHRQSRLHSQLVVRTWVEKIGNSSVTIFQHLIDRADGGINADCRSVAVGYDDIFPAGTIFGTTRTAVVWHGDEIRYTLSDGTGHSEAYSMYVVPLYD